METMKKRKYNKRTPRQYMEAIREMVNARGVFYLRDVSARHFGTRQARMGEAMRSLGWVTRDGNGLAWVGKRPKTEAELLAMATILSENVRSRDLASYRAYSKKRKKPRAKSGGEKQGIAEIADEAARIYEDRHQFDDSQQNSWPGYVGAGGWRMPLRKKYSILWGLFTWEK